MIATWERLTATSVSGRPLAATRMLFSAAALVMLHSAWRRIGDGFDPGWIHVPWPIVEDHLVGFPPGVVIALWGVGAVALFLGLVPRLAAASVVLGMGAFYAVDQQHYANGGYFIVVVGILLVLADSGASWTPWGPDRRRPSWWTSFLLALQLTIVYLYAAGQKLRGPALRGATIDWQLNGPAMDHITWSRLPEALNLLGGTAEVVCAIGLWFAATRRVALVVGITLHVGILAFIRDSPDLIAFGLASFALYPAFWVASPPLGAAVRQLRSRAPRSAEARDQAEPAGQT